jgi:hypothetical protein
MNAEPAVHIQLTIVIPLPSSDLAKNRSRAIFLIFHWKRIFLILVIRENLEFDILVETGPTPWLKSRRKVNQERTSLLSSIEN